MALFETGLSGLQEICRMSDQGAIMEPRQDTILRAVFLLGVASSVAFGQAGLQKRISFEEYIRETVPTRPEIDVFLNETS